LGGGGIWAWGPAVLLIASKGQSSVSCQCVRKYQWVSHCSSSRGHGVLATTVMRRPTFVLPPHFVIEPSPGTWADTHSALSNDLAMVIPCSFGVFRVFLHIQLIFARCSSPWYLLLSLARPAASASMRFSVGISLYRSWGPRWEGIELFLSCIVVDVAGLERS
jgi:hypothetical protein